MQRFTRALKQLAPPRRSLSVVLYCLAEIWSSGLKLGGAFDLAASTVAADHPVMADLLTKVQQKVNRGSEVSAALSAHSAVFPSHYVQAIRVGEKSGRLADVLRMLADLEKQWFETRWAIYQALMVPVLMLLLLTVLTFGILPGFITSIIPALGDQEQLPWVTRLLLKGAQAMRSWPFWLFLLGLGALGLRVLAKPLLRTRVLEAIHHLPVIGEALRAAAYHSFFASLHVGIRSGSDIKQSLLGAAEASGNQPLAQAVEEKTRTLIEGTTAPIEIFDSFDPIARALVGSALETGTLEEATERLTRHYRTTLEDSITTALDLLNPFLTLMMGAVVGVILIATLLPLANLADSFL